RKVMAATADMARSRLSRLPDEPSFRDVALRRYGRTIADAFLLHYTEKLWSTPAERLSPAVSGKRLKGLDVRTFVMETFAGRRSKTKHLDGSFHYPRLGIGMLMDRLADAVGRESIRTEARITRLRHAHERIFELEINGTERVPVDRIVSTLPISLLMSILDPPPPEEVLTAARALRFQSVTLVVLFLSRAQVTRAASLYFPDPTIPFTRAYEPKNRSAAMSPHDCTSLAIEIPGTPAVLPMKDEAALIQAVTDILTRIGIIESKDVTGSLIHHIPFAYPILELGTEARLTTITDYLERFRNLHSIGRGGAFAYVHIHDLMYAAREVTESVLASRS
ncbi:FAD-dependent oxidoreductase, partial [bacterium]|nr:FAD-dependent oxidoreductase [bacterium]